MTEKRYSVRKYRETPVSRQDIEKILSAAKSAPTACNRQPQKIFVIESEEGLRLLEKCTVCRYHPPLAFLVCYDKESVWVREYDGKNSGDVDASIVTAQMMLEAENLGLGSTWIMHFIPEAVVTEFGLTEDTVPVAILYVGYKDGEPSPLHESRRDPEEYTVFL